MTSSAGSSSSLPATDLARRISARRTEKGMSVEALAAAAGIDPGYLAYFERTPDANLSGGTLLLIALVLDTSPKELLGGTIDETPGRRGRARPHASLNELTSEQCLAHLSANGVGRLVQATPRGPVAIPVNYEFTEGQVIFSTDGAKAARLSDAGVVGFEIDRVDDVLSEGWSVVVTGTCRHVTDADEVQRFASLSLEPWAGREGREQLVAITPTEITGRVIIHEAPPDQD